MFVVIAGIAGNVNPKLTIAVEAFREVNDIVSDPRIVQFARFVIAVPFAAIADVFVAMFAVLTFVFVSTEPSAVST